VVKKNHIKFIRFADLKYPYQINELSIKVPNKIISNEDISILIEKFHELHEKVFTYAIRDSICQFVSLRVMAIHEVDKINSLEPESSEDNSDIAIKDNRKIVLEGDNSCTVPIYDGRILKPGMKVKGPAIVEEAATTILILPENRLFVDRWNNYEITIKL